MKRNKKNNKSLLTPEERAMLYVARKNERSLATGKELSPDDFDDIEKWTKSMEKRFVETKATLAIRYKKALEKKGICTRSREEVLNSELISFGNSIDKIEEYKDYYDWCTHKTLSDLFASCIPPFKKGALHFDAGGYPMYIDWVVTSIDSDKRICDILLTVYSNAKDVESKFNNTRTWSVQTIIPCVIKIEQGEIILSIKQEGFIPTSKMYSMLSKEELGWSAFEMELWKVSTASIVNGLGVRKGNNFISYELVLFKSFVNMIRFVNFLLSKEKHSNSILKRIKNFFVPTREVGERTERTYDFVTITSREVPKESTIWSISSLWVEFQSVKNPPSWSLENIDYRRNFSDAK